MSDLAAVFNLASTQTGRGQMSTTTIRPLATYLSKAYNFSTQADTLAAMEMGKELFEAGLGEAAAQPSAPLATQAVLRKVNCDIADALEWMRQGLPLKARAVMLEIQEYIAALDRAEARRYTVEIVKEEK